MTALAVIVLLVTLCALLRFAVPLRIAVERVRLFVVATPRAASARDLRNLLGRQGERCRRR